MDEGKMVASVNRIAKFFVSYPPEEAIPGIADHIEKFWEPRYRRQLDEYALAGGAGLHELVMAALEQLRHPTAAGNQVRRDPRSHGLPDPAGRGSDAG